MVARFALVIGLSALATVLSAQQPAGQPPAKAPPAAPAVKVQEPAAAGAEAVNVAIVPASRTDAGILARQEEVVRRAKEAEPTPVVFVGDSITQGWETTGKDVWAKHVAPFGAVNLGVSGDRTEHVLWRLQEAPLTRLKPKVIVLLIGTNNLGHRSSNAEQTLAGVLAVLKKLREQAPDAWILVNEIFPRGERINAMRGDILQVNQAVRGQLDARMKSLPIGDRWVEADGTIRKDVMPDFLHLTAAAYEQWAMALVPEIEAALR